MTNFVTVTGQAVDFGGGPVGGHLDFTVSDLVWAPTLALFSAGATVGVTFGAGSPAWAISLFATDNAGISTNWKWKLTGNVNGFVFPPRLLTVDFANGATQDLSALLATSTLA